MTVADAEVEGEGGESGEDSELTSDYSRERESQFPAVISLFRENKSTMRRREGIGLTCGPETVSWRDIVQ